jgi:ubiquinone/menaquinone biosynthesis C-methylase UbiE
VGLRGQVAFKSAQIRGWAVGDGDRTIEIEARDSSTRHVLWRGKADRPRNNAKFDNKNCGFEFAVSGRYIKDGGAIEFIEPESGRRLPFSPFVFRKEHEKHVHRLNQLSHWPLLHLQGVKQHGTKIIAHIVAIGGEGQQAPRLYAENAQGKRELSKEEVRAVPASDDRVAGRFWFAEVWPQTVYSVDLTAPFSAPLRDETGVLFVRLAIESEGRDQVISLTRDAGLVSTMNVTIPPDENVRRVQAKGYIEQKFTASAFSQYRTYRQVFEQYSGKRWLDIGRILDWGCGCARVTQHLMKSLGNDRVYGTDIDGANIQWCLANLPSRNFVRCELTPPLPYAENTFDYVVATSVLTHIQESILGDWLADIRRILKPDGLAALTVASESRMAFGSYDAERLEAVERSGIEDGIANSQLNGVIADTDYYRNVRMTKDYIRKKWAPHFEVLDVIDHAIGVQDIVVGRKRQ